MIYVLFILMTLWVPSVSFAETTLQWDRNVETDMAYYTVYYCQTNGCTVDKATAVKSTNIPQVAVGALPTFTLPAVVVGSIAVTATNSENNESPLSSQVAFNTVCPAAPTNLRIQ